MFGNHLPKIKGTDEGIWRRVRIIPFKVIKPEKQIPDMPKKIREELPGILAWAVRGCLEWQKHGLGTCKAVEVATQEYRVEMDSFGRFLDECCVDTSKGVYPTKTPAQALYNRYLQWLTGWGERYPMSVTSFGIKLRERGFKQAKSGNTRLWTGISLILKDDIPF
jgi:putative DNA primase/helicase